MAIIRSPNPEFSAVRRGVAFARGRGESDDPAVVESFRRRGWAVEGGSPRRSASKADWVAYAVSQGTPRDEAEAMTRDDLAEAHG